MAVRCGPQASPVGLSQTFAIVVLPKHPYEIPLRQQRMRMRTLEYDFTISHDPGKGMHTADVLSRKFHHHDTDVGNADSYIDQHEVLILENCHNV